METSFLGLIPFPSAAEGNFVDDGKRYSFSKWLQATGHQHRCEYKTQRCKSLEEGWKMMTQWIKGIADNLSLVSRTHVVEEEY